MSKITLEKIEAGIAEGPFDASWDSLEAYEFPDWYHGRQVRHLHPLGALLRAGLRQRVVRTPHVRAGTKEYEHHRDTYGPQDEFGYKDFIPMFTAEKFDAVAWAKLFKDGRRHVCRARGRAPRRLPDVRQRSLPSGTRPRWDPSATSSANWPRPCVPRI